jgi:hypothetical protein
VAEVQVGAVPRIGNQWEVAWLVGAGQVHRCSMACGKNAIVPSRGVAED